jgi:V-type H+-transporting ATPase subunit C
MGQFIASIATHGEASDGVQTDLLKLTRVNFSEAYQILTHLKCVRLFVESVLRYGLPADYAGVIVRPEPKTAVKSLKTLSGQFSYLAGASQGPGGGKKNKSGGAVNDDVQGEWASVMEAEYYDFVLFEIPKVEF